MNTSKQTLPKNLEAEMIGASALMEAKQRLDNESPDYVRGFVQGYYHCMKLSEKLDALIVTEESR